MQISRGGNERSGAAGTSDRVERFTHSGELDGRVPFTEVVATMTTVTTRATPKSHPRSLRGRSIVFHTAIALVRGERAEVDEVPTEVHFRDLDDAALERYLHADRPYDCAGAARVESLGIALLDRVRSDDPTALIGMPLICVTRLLGRFGVEVLAA